MTTNYHPNHSVTQTKAQDKIWPEFSLAQATNKPPSPPISLASNYLSRFDFVS